MNYAGRKLAASLFALSLCLSPFQAPAAQAAAPAFAPCTDASTRPQLLGSLCATRQVRADHGDPASGHLELFIRKFP